MCHRERASLATFLSSSLALLQHPIVIAAAALEYIIDEGSWHSTLLILPLFFFLLFLLAAAALEYIIVEGAKHALRNGAADTPFLEVRFESAVQKAAPCCSGSVVEL